MRRLTRFLPVGVVLVAFSLYRWTLLPEVDWSDAAELSLQAYQLGVTHPPGYPLHTLLGKLFILVVGDPGIATNLLSAVCTSLAAGLLCQIALDTTRNGIASVLAALVFAAAPAIWDQAVTTEVYGVNSLFVALTIFLLLRWHRAPSTARLAAAAAVFGLSLGSYLANLLLTPAFLFLIVSRCRASTAHPRASGNSPQACVLDTRFRGPGSRMALFIAIVALTGALILSWSVFRAPSMPPLGTPFVPDTPARFFLFVSGAQYQTARLPTPAFYAARLAEHAGIFARAFFWAGVGLGALGLVRQWRVARHVALALGAVFLIDVGYFTGYAATDYHTMVAPAYLVFAVWIAHGLDALAGRSLPQALVQAGWALAGVGLAAFALLSDRLGIGQPGFGPAQVAMLVLGCGLAVAALALRRSKWLTWLSNNAGRVAALLLALLVLGGQLRSHLDPRLARSRSAQVTEYVAASFEVLPQNAVVIASWDKFAPLLFFQRTQGLRQDLTIIERTLEAEPSLRTYAFGTLPDWRAFLAESAGGRPVCVDAVDAALEGQYTFEPIPHGWYQLLSPVLPGG